MGCFPYVSLFAGIIAVFVALVLVRRRHPYELLDYCVSGTKSSLSRNTNSLPSTDHSGDVTEIWGIAAISTFLWESIFEAEMEIQNHSWFHGELRFGDRILKYRSGPAISRGHVPTDVKKLVLVLNGRSDGKVAEALEWLNSVEKLPNLVVLSVVLLGSELCDNSWILPQMRSRGGRINQLFVVYDSGDLDGEEIHQWPLGTATYRGFPRECCPEDVLDRPRRFAFNFFGTLHGSVPSRLHLTSILDGSIEKKYRGLTGIRDSWLEAEPADSLRQHVTALLNSDITLCPRGLNVETYRIYEALSCGSVPVIVNEKPSGECVGDLRLLRKHGLPAIYLNSWDELLPVLDAEMSLSVEDKVRRRREVFSWYRRFLRNMREEMLSFILYS